MIGEKLGPYEILESIGSGGMGEVWKARDTRLNRTVAIKKVKEQHSERFKREAQSIAALNHPNICQIFDIGPNYLVLEYVAGKPLSSPQSEQEALRLAIQIATALEAAHKKGIIHRDLKPSNIMVTDEASVKLLDFGLAKLFEQDQSVSSLPTADMPQTQAGAILGTVAYMSPEQAKGQPADARSDIFSFGLVLYEMLSGKRAFFGDSNYEVMDAIVRKEPSPLQTSPPLDKIVKRCLEKHPSERYQTMSELRAALEKAVAKKVTVSSTESQPSIAVLPFVNMSEDKEQEYFSDGLSEEIINALTKIPGLKVIARTSSFSFRDKKADIGQIRDRLKVQHILEGSVRKAGNRIRVTAQLIDTADESHLWSERYDSEMTDLFEIQDEISQAIARKLQVQLSGEPAPTKRSTENTDAYNLYLKGRYHVHKFTYESMMKGKEYFEQAIVIDSQYALAWYGIANFYHTAAFVEYMPPKEADAKSLQAALKALEFDETLPEVHSIMAILRANEFDWKGAQSEFQQALALDPESEQVWSDYRFYYLVPMGRFDEAIASNRRDLELDPLSAFLHWRLGSWYYFSRQWDSAIMKLNNSLEIDPHYWASHYILGLAYIQTGNFEEAIRASERTQKIYGHSPLSLECLTMAHAAAGNINKAQKYLVQMEDLAQKSYVSNYSFASSYVALGETEKCLDLLEKAIEERERRSIHFHLHPYFDPLRSHPRYKALIRKMNLQP